MRHFVAIQLDVSGEKCHRRPITRITPDTCMALIICHRNDHKRRAQALRQIRHRYDKRDGAFG